MTRKYMTMVLSVALLCGFWTTPVKPGVVDKVTGVVQLAGSFCLAKCAIICATAAIGGTTLIMSSKNSDVSTDAVRAISGFAYGALFGTGACVSGIGAYYCAKWGINNVIS